MKQPILLTCVLSAVAAATGAGVAIVSVAPNQAETKAMDDSARPSRVAAQDARFDALLAQLRSLEVANDDLRARIHALEARPSDDARVQVAESETPRPEELAALPPEEVHATVAKALEDLRANEKAEAQRVREQREAERLEERLKRMSDQLGLSPAQVADIRALLVAQRDARDDLEQRRESLGSRDAYRTERDALRELEEESLARILTPTQLESYRGRDARRDDPRGRSNRSSRNRGSGQRNG